jgi:hypothetical protein
MMTIAARIILSYYLATPLFLLVDLFWHAPLRVAFIESTGLRFAYYGFCFLCGLMMWRKPASAPALGILECAVNLLLLMLSILLPIWSVDAIAAGAGLPEFGLARLANVMLSGTMLVACFHARQAELVRAIERSRA